MNYIDPHIHMVSRTTDDYETLAKMGCVAMSEPAFWAGYDRGSADGFRDYFNQLTDVEPKRAAQYGIQHFAWLCINACLLYTSPSPRDGLLSRMPSSA